MRLTMFISVGILFLVAYSAWSIWGKLCDIEQKLFRMHDEISLTLPDIERDLRQLEDAVERVENNLDNN